MSKSNQGNQDSGGNQRNYKIPFWFVLLLSVEQSFFCYFRILKIIYIQEILKSVINVLKA